MGNKMELDLKQKFEKQQRCVKLSWQELKDLFEQPCYTFQDIADASNVTRQAVAQAYNKYFLPTQEFESGQERRKACTSSRRTQLLNVRPQDNPMLGDLWDTMKQHGYVPSRVRVSTTQRNYYRKWCLMCNGKTVKLARTPKKFVQRHRVYGRLHSGTLPNGIDILVTRFDGAWWVLPANVRQKETVYLPMGDYPTYHKTKRAEVDWRQFRDKWDLLDWGVDELQNWLGWK